MERNQLDLRVASHSDSLEIKDLWIEVFPFDRMFINYYFRVYEPENILVASWKNKVVSMVHFMPCEFFYRGNLFNSGYIFGVATHKDFRGMGLASQLMKKTHQLMKMRGFLYSMLVPASFSLFEYYARFDYKPYFRMTGSHLDLPLWKGGCRKALYNDIEELNLIYENFLYGRSFVKRSNSYWKILIDTEDLIVYPEKGSLRGYCFFSYDKNLVINELFTVDEDAEMRLKGFLRFLAPSARFFSPAADKSGEYSGAIRPIADDLTFLNEPLPSYMNMVFNT